MTHPVPFNVVLAPRWQGEESRGASAAGRTLSTPEEADQRPGCRVSDMRPDRQVRDDRGGVRRRPRTFARNGKPSPRCSRSLTDSGVALSGRCFAAGAKRGDRTLFVGSESRESTDPSHEGDPPFLARSVSQSASHGIAGTSTVRFCSLIAFSGHACVHKPHPQHASGSTVKACLPPCAKSLKRPTKIAQLSRSLVPDEAPINRSDKYPHTDPWLHIAFAR